MRKQLFLTSSVHKVAHDISKKIDLSKGKKLVFINTAAEVETGDMQWTIDDKQALVDAGFDVTNYTITGTNKQQLEIDLANYDHIYVEGGNTLYLLKQSQLSGFNEVVKDLILNQGKTYIGTSAGSIIAGPKAHDYLLEENESIELSEHEGYNFVNFLVMPHWGSEFFRDLYLKGRLEIAYKEDQIPLILLTDNQYVHVQDEQFKIIDVKNIS